MPKYNQTRLLQETFKFKQIEIASRLIQGQANKIKEKIMPQRISLVDQFLPQTNCFQDIKGTGNRLSNIVIDYQRHITNKLFKKGFEI